MKLSEMARKAKEKLIGVFSGKRKKESGQETAEMSAQKVQEVQKDEKTDISAQDDTKGQETAKTEPTGQEETILAIDTAAGQDMTGYRKAGMTETQIRKMELWKRYYEEKRKCPIMSADDAGSRWYDVRNGSSTELGKRKKEAHGR